LTISENSVSDPLNPLVVKLAMFWLIEANASLWPYSAEMLGMYRGLAVI
jgi:hypothetical protein